MPEYESSVTTSEDERRAFSYTLVEFPISESLKSVLDAEEGVRSRLCLFEAPSLDSAKKRHEELVQIDRATRWILYGGDE